MSIQAYINEESKKASELIQKDVDHIVSIIDKETNGSVFGRTISIRDRNIFGFERLRDKKFIRVLEGHYKCPITTEYYTSSYGDDNGDFDENIRLCFAESVTQFKKKYEQELENRRKMFNQY